MKNNHISLYIDLLFCLVIMPLVIMLLPVDHWIVNREQHGFSGDACRLCLFALFRLPLGLSAQDVHAKELYADLCVDVGIGGDYGCVDIFSTSFRMGGCYSQNGRSSFAYPYTNYLVLFPYGNRIFVGY